MLTSIIGGFSMPKLCGENFCGWLYNGEIHECFLPRKFSTIRYLREGWHAGGVRYNILYNSNCMCSFNSSPHTLNLHIYKPCPQQHLVLEFYSTCNYRCQVVLFEKEIKNISHYNIMERIPSHVHMKIFLRAYLHDKCYNVASLFNYTVIET